MLVQVLQQLLRIRMLWKNLQRLIRHLETLLELSLLEKKESRIVTRLEEESCDAGSLLKIAFSLVDVSLAEL